MKRDIGLEEKNAMIYIILPMKMREKFKKNVLLK